ncbi:hypothetical protein SAMN06297422_10662 [Lachnospiraceae bacterium]|nr:hypothetical protein SAMN06297422_10662 [Lachnospiraceae bacterium]
MSKKKKKKNRIAKDKSNENTKVTLHKRSEFESKSNDKSNSRGEPLYKPKSIGEAIVVYTCIAILTVFPLILIIVCVGLAIYTAITDVDRTAPAGKRQSNVELYGETIYLKKVDDDSYRIVSEKDDYDREFVWKEKAHSYCDRHSYNYIWYDKDSKEWMYWIYTISDDYSIYGWMKYDENGWTIETKDGWKKLPEKHNRERLWYIVEM